MIGRIKNKLAILIPAALLVIGIAVAYNMIKENRSLPIYSPMMINPELVDESKRDVKKNHRISSFELTNQEGELFTDENLNGKYYVTDFFFTTCPTICPDMSSQLKRVQEAYQNATDFMIISHSVTPQIDTP